MIYIFLCSYNGENYIREQIESILQQKTEQDFQILASDDGSTDGTVELLREIQSKVGDKKLKILEQSPPNRSARKHFLKLFTEGCWQGADYIMLSDQDDVWHPDKIEKYYREMKKWEKPDIPILLHGDASVVDENLVEISPSFSAYQKMSPERHKLCQLLVQNNVVGGSVMLNAALAAKIRVLPEHSVMHDHWMALLAASLGELHYLPESLYCYRQHGDNVVGAERGTRLGEILKRLGFFQKDGKSRAEMDAHSRKVYRDLFLQAEEFLSIYREELKEGDRALLQAFLSIPGKNRLGKMLTVLRYGFTFNLLHRTVGELIFI